MSENAQVEAQGPHEDFLTERLAALREENPGFPVAYLRMRLMKELVEELRVSPRHAKSTVEAFLARHGLGVRQPTVRESILTGIVGAVVLLALLSPLYFFLKALRPR